MQKNNAKIGIIGIAVMGANLARNFADKKISTAVFNRTYEKTEKFIKTYGNEHLTGTKTLREFVDAIERPRKILILVKAGKAIDDVLSKLAPLLDKGDIVMDVGNSHYKDTILRAATLGKKNLHFWGCGISGGEEGALKGPSLMPGGPQETWQEIKPYLEAVAAKDFSGGPCVTYLGPAQSGHFIKMVHNGIEYGIMQTIAEAYDILSLLFQMPAPQIGQVFDKFNRSKLNSYLYGLTSRILQKQDDETGNGYLVDRILDKAEQKGTGMWTVIDSMEKAVPTPTIAQAVMSRIISGDKDKRIKISKKFKERFERENLDLDEFIYMLDDALFIGMICAFAQGIELIQKTSTLNKWDIKIPEVMRIWQGGCIIRAKILASFEHCYKDEAGEYDTHLFQLPETVSNIKGNIKNLRNIVGTAVRNEIPVPCLSSAVAYFDGMTQEKSSANLIQALRDAFGAHKYERIDKEGLKHTEW